MSDDTRTLHELLERGVAPVPVPHGLLERILERVESEPAPVPLRRRRLGPVLAAAAAVACLALAAAVFVRVTDDAAPDASAALSAPSGPVHGEARLYGLRSPGGRLVLDLRDVPPAPAGHHYEVWVLRGQADGAMEAVGAFTPDGSALHAELPLPGPGDYRAVDVSVEPDGGSPAHSGVSLAGGVFPA